MGKLSNKVAVVTGGSSGIGLATAKRFVDEGAYVFITGRRQAELDKAKAQIGRNISVIQGDVANLDDLDRLYKVVKSEKGGLDIVIANAGFVETQTLATSTPEHFDRTFNTNARGPFLIMQGVIRHLVETGQSGSIVNIISMAAHCGQSYLTPYSASKGALATLTKNVANAYASKRIRCNGILLGWMDTPGESATQQKFHGVGKDWLAKAEAAQPMGQLVKADQVAGLVAYMLSPESGVMTGALVDYDQNVAGAYPE